MQGETAAKHATAVAQQSASITTALCGVVFTDPQIGAVGLSEQQLKERGIDYLSRRLSLRRPRQVHPNGSEIRLRQSLRRYAAGVVLGAECVSKDAGELIHAMAVAVTLKANVRDLLKVHWYHPTLAEIWSYPIEDIVDELV